VVVLDEKVQDFIKEYNQFLITSFSKVFPLVVVEGRDVFVYDLEGRRYLDFWAGIATVNLGHCNPKVQEAAKKQMERLVHIASYAYYTIPPLNLAKKLAKIAPFTPCKSVFCTSGSEAIEVSVKIAKRFTKKHDILSLYGSYHGRTYAAQTVSSTPGSYRKSYVVGPYLPGFVHAPAPYCYRCSLGYEYPACNIQCAKILEDLINFATTREVAAYIAEPILGVGGIVTPPNEYFQEVKKVLDKYGILMVLDEVQTGLGRTGKIWGAETYNIKPDIIVLAKALGNGWPISAVLTRVDVGDSLEVGDYFATWGAHPVMCAAAEATIDYLIEFKLWENAEKMGTLMLKGLREFEEGFEVVGDVRGRGLMIGVEIVRDKRSKEPNAEAALKIREVCAKNGLLVGLGGWWNNVLRIQPPLTLKEEHIEEALNIFEKTLKEVREI
jgi:4-aminobutyrate aminotransferase-like enzyme